MFLCPDVSIVSGEAGEHVPEAAPRRADLGGTAGILGLRGAGEEVASCSGMGAHVKVRYLLATGAEEERDPRRSEKGRGVLSGRLEMRLSVLEEGWLVTAADGLVAEGGEGVEDVDSGETGAGGDAGEVLAATRLPVLERREACAAGLLAEGEAALEEAIVGAIK